MTEISDKNKTNRKWTSNRNYRDNYDKIFGRDAKKTRSCCPKCGGASYWFGLTTTRCECCLYISDDQEFEVKERK